MIISKSPFRIAFAAIAPVSINILGFTSSICLITNGRQISISSSVGFLLPGGLQGILFMMKVSSIVNSIALSIFLNNNPLLETKDKPFLSSFSSGGPSIISIFESNY